MRLNWLERVMVNSPFDAVLQRRFEAPKMVSMGGRMNGGVALEVGCGRGLGAELIVDLAGADRVHAFDLDPRMIRLAQRRIAGGNRNIRLWLGDATAIPAKNDTYDAVFDFVIIHHIAAWRDALREIYRVMKPGGRFYAQEGLKRLVVNPVIKRLVVHPLDDPFDHDLFCEGLRSCGFRVVDTRHYRNWFGFFIADKPAR